jgi:ligand-binding sensor domain-containing protein
VTTIKPYLFIVLVLAGSIFRAQNKSFTFQHYGPEEGLSNSNIQAVKQGPDGLMYITSQNGAYTYDGYNFEKLKITGLKSNTIRNVYFQGKDLFLINREEGIYKIDPKTKQASPTDLKFKNQIDEIVIAGDYAYSLSDKIKINVLNLKTKELVEDKVQERDKKKERSNQAYCIYKTSAGKVLIGRTDGLYIFNGAEQEKISQLKDISVYSICETAENKLVIGTANRILVLGNDYKVEKEYYPKFKASKTFFLSLEKDINKLIVDKYNRFWFTSYPDNNLYVLEDNILYDVFEILNIQPSLINSLTKDKNENIWVGTFTDGMYFIQNPFMFNFSLSFNKKNLNVTTASVKGDVVVAGTNNGLYAYHLGSHETKTLSSPEVELIPEQIYNITFQNNALYYAKRRTFNSVGPVNYKGLKFIPVEDSKYICLLDKNSAIISKAGIIMKVNLRTEKVLDTIYSFSDYRIGINSMLLRDDKLFIGTSGGLVLINLKNKSVVNDTVFNYAINHITLINDRMYLAHDAGFSIYEEKKLYDRIGEVRLSAVKKIAFYKNIIWLATLNGLYLCDPRLDPITVYNKSNGLLSSAVNDISFDNDKTVIATDRGISVSATSQLLNSRFKPDPVQINYFEVEENSYYELPPVIKLNSSQKNLTIHFSSPLFTKPNQQLFRWQMDKGKLKDVNDKINIAEVPGGKHLIRIYSSSDGITWSDEVRINIEKEVAFSETPMLYVVITGAGLLIIIIISYIWIKQVKKKAKKRIKEEQQINLLKHQAMNSLLSPHFIFNSLTSIQNYINTNNSLMASEYLAKFSRLIRMIIEKASQSQITLRDEIVRLNYYLDLEKERFKNKFDFKIEVAQDLDMDAITIPNMIIQPHAENSIIHGILPKNEHGTLKIGFAKSKDNELLIRIEDDGIGLIKAREHAKSNHKSLGTSTIANILELNSKLYNKKQSVKMEDKSTLDPSSHGTLISITLEL